MTDNTPTQEARELLAAELVGHLSADVIGDVLEGGTRRIPASLALRAIEKALSRPQAGGGDGVLAPEFREEVWTAVHSATVTGSAEDVTAATARICEALSATPSEDAVRAASLGWQVEGSIYEGMAASVSDGERTIAHVREYGDALAIVWMANNIPNPSANAGGDAGNELAIIPAKLLKDVVDLIEGFPGYGTSMNLDGRLKDQPRWVRFYNAVAALTKEEGQA